MVHATQQSNGKPAAQRKPEPAKRCEPEDVLLQQRTSTPTPPDGGWGWAVVFASFMVHVITDGVTYSYGVFHVQFIDFFQSTDAKAAWVASLLVGVTYCSGPISSAFVNRFGCRAVTIAGTLLASGCLVASFWMPSLEWLYLTAGVGTGLGFGLIYLPAIVSVTVYFDKYRSLATGIAVCGSGLGTVVFAPFITFLIGEFGNFRHSMLILGGIVLNCVVLGAMFRALEPPRPAAESLPLEAVGPADRRPSREAARGPEAARRGSGVRPALSQPALGPPAPPEQPAPLVRASCLRGSGVMDRSDVFLRSSVHSVRKRSESLCGSRENVRGLRLSLRSLPTHGGPRFSVGESHQQLGAVEQPALSDGIVRRMLRFSLLRDPLFIVFTLSNFCTSIGFNVPYVYLIPQAEKLSISNTDASMLLSVIGIANTVGRVVLGYISDKPWVNRLLVYNVCLTVCGLATMICPFCPDFVTLAMYASVYGFTAGAYVGLTSVCLVDLVGLERLTNAFGLVLLAQGVASFLGPPIAGALKDYSGNYLGSFLLAGAMIAVSGLVLFVVPPIQKRIMLRQEKQLQGFNGISA